MIKWMLDCHLLKVIFLLFSPRELHLATSEHCFALLDELYWQLW